MNSSHHLWLAALLLAGCAGQPTPYAARLGEWESRQQATQYQAAEFSGSFSAEANLASLLRYARLHNPGLKAAFEHWKAALERIPQASALANPKLTLSSYLSEIETRVGPIRGSVGLTQSFPWFGTRQLSGEVSFATSEVAREMLEATRLELDQGLRDGWYELAWVEQAIQIAEGNRDLLSHSESVASVRMATGLSSHADVIRAQVELGKLEDRVQSLRDLRRPLAARLNGLMNRMPDAPLPSPGVPQLGAREVNGLELRDQLASSNPLMRALQHRVQGARFSIELANKAYYPGFFLGLDYSVVGSASGSGVAGSGDDVLALKLGFDLPVWRAKYAAGVRSAEALARGLQLEREDTLNRLRTELELALFRWREANRRVTLFADSLVPKGEESIQALDTAYQSGDGGFLDLIDAQRVLLEFQLQVARARADRAQALAQIERITGIQLNLEQ